MKWFKHDSDASNDAKLKKLRLKYGAQGYGIYWYCLELIARNVEKHNLTFELEHDAELIADDFKLSSDLVQHIMTYMVELELFENINGVVSCLKMANRTDEYTQKLLQGIKKATDSVGIVSGETPTKSVLIEENIIKENKYIHETASFRKTSIPDNFTISERVKKWAEEKGHADINKHLEFFIGACNARGYKYINWDDAFMNAVRSNWANIESKTIPDWKRDLI